MIAALYVFAAIGFIAGLTGWMRGQRGDVTGAVLAILAVVGCLTSTALLVALVL